MVLAADWLVLLHANPPNQLQNVGAGLPHREPLNACVLLNIFDKGPREIVAAADAERLELLEVAEEIVFRPVAVSDIEMLQ